jgi:PBSX family phage portal protein
MNPEKPVKRIQVLVLADSEGNIRFADRSQQVADPKTWWTHLGLVPPPYDPESLGEILEKNTWHKRCCRQISSDTAGLGYTLRPRETPKEGSEPVPPQEIRDFLENPNTELSLRSTLEAAQTDFESIGYMALELVKTVGGSPIQLWHIPAITLRVHKSKKKFCQVRGIKKTWFSSFDLRDENGKPIYINKETGEEETTLTFEQRGNEILFLKNYVPSNTFYGVPCIITALGAVSMLLGIRDFHLDFFDNNAIPAWAVIIEGGDITQEVKDKIEAHLKGLKGSGGAHSTMIIACDDENVKIHFQRLSVEAKEGSFPTLSKGCRDEVINAHGVPPHRIGIIEVGSLGGNVALEATRIYKTSVISPRQEDLENMINRIISKFPSGKEWKFKFAEMDLTDEFMDVKLSRALMEMGALTPNKVIQRLNLGPTFDGGDIRLFSRQLVPADQLKDASSKDKIRNKTKLPKDEKTPDEEEEQEEGFPSETET